MEYDPSHRAQQKENDLLKRALAGDQSAKNEIDAKALMIAADKINTDLRTKAAKGDKAAMAALKQRASIATSSAVSAGKVSSSSGTASDVAPRKEIAFTLADLREARQQAVKSERARVAQVFASEHSVGREQGLVRLLTSAHNWSATQILAELPHLPTDRRTSGQELVDQRAVDSWAKAYGSSQDAAPAASGASAAASVTVGADDPADGWAKAWKEIRS